MNQINMQIKNLRVDFESLNLEKIQVDKSPIVQFIRWLENALEAKINEPHAMTLSTANKKGQPDARVVLLRGVEKKGFSFFTNYKSAKGKEIVENKKVCLSFYWAELARQVRIKGVAVKLSAKNSDDYFESRPRESQISAWASSQSEMIENRDVLIKKYNEFEKKFENKKVPRPLHWGGYLVIPDSMEFWQGRNNRLHDRIQYEKSKSGKWKIARLCP